MRMCDKNENGVTPGWVSGGAVALRAAWPSPADEKMPLWTAPTKCDVGQKAAGHRGGLQTSVPLK